MSGMRRVGKITGFPTRREEREELAAMIGGDGRILLTLIDAPSSPTWLREIPAVLILRRVWIQQFYAHEQDARWRNATDLPPASLLICTPYDPDARFGKKRATIWTGYKVHVTESCDDDAPHLVTDVHTTPATTSDFEMIPPIQAALAHQQILPSEHARRCRICDHQPSHHESSSVCSEAHWTCRP